MKPASPSQPTPRSGHPAARRRGLSALAGAVVIFLLVVILAAGGCGSADTSGSSGTSGSTQTSGSSGAASGPTTAGSTPPTAPSTSAPPLAGINESNQYGQQLVETSQAAATLADELANKGAKDPDLTAQIYGLRARSQALVAARALLDNQPQLADEALMQMRQLLNRGLAAGSSRWTELLQSALTAANAAPVPSADPGRARAQLDELSTELAQLLPEPAESSGSEPAGGPAS